MEKGKIIPFYMAYPLPLYYEDEQEVVKDMEYLQSQHSPEIRSLQREIMEVINLLDYEGSMIYDEYPDKLQLRLICSRVYEKVMEQEKIKEFSLEDNQIQEQVRRPVRSRRKPDRIRDIIELLTFHELMRRRNRHREQQRRRYW